MSKRNILLAILIFQVIPIILYPVKTISAGISVIGVVVLLFALIGFGLWRGRPWALTLSIFIQGVNVIIRMMMVISHAQNKAGVWDLTIIVAHTLAIILSIWFLTRLDRPDIRSMIAA